MLAPASFFSVRLISASVTKACFKSLSNCCFSSRLKVSRNPGFILPFKLDSQPNGSSFIDLPVFTLVPPYVYTLSSTLFTSSAIDARTLKSSNCSKVSASLVFGPFSNAFASISANPGMSLNMRIVSFA